MFYFNFEHTTKKIMLTSSGKDKRSSIAQSKFHYLTRTGSFEQYKDDVSEVIEFTQSGYLPEFAQGKAEEFWQAADCYERNNGRVCASFVVALPKELNVKQRIELAENFIEEFAGRYQFPYSCAIHNHPGAFAGKEQPHLHFMYSERSIQDGIERPEKQFFKRYDAKTPEKGGAKKLTADELGLKRNQVQLFREKTEELINHSLRQYAPTKRVVIRGVQLEVPNVVSCLSNKDYNAKYGTTLEDAPMMPKRVRFAKEDKDAELFAQQQEMLAEIQRIRRENEYQLYQSYYDAEIRRISELEQAQTQRNRGYDGPSF